MPKSGRVFPTTEREVVTIYRGASAGQSEGAGSETVDDSQIKGEQTQVSTVCS